MYPLYEDMAVMSDSSCCDGRSFNGSATRRVTVMHRFCDMKKPLSVVLTRALKMLAVLCIDYVRAFTSFLVLTTTRFAGIRIIERARHIGALLIVISCLIVTN